jgi:hypothetical protein
MAGDPAGPDIGADGLAELVRHYAHTPAVAPSPAVYGELLSARSFAGTLLGRSAPRQRPDLTVTAGWLSSLLAISAADLGDHAAAVIWCADTERRGRDASYPDLLGWAALTRSLIAWYQGDPLVTRTSWPEISDGRRRVLRESQEVPRRISERTCRAAQKADGAWQLS